MDIRDEAVKISKLRWQREEACRSLDAIEGPTGFGWPSRLGRWAKPKAEARFLEGFFTVGHRGSFLAAGARDSVSLVGGIGPKTDGIIMDQKNRLGMSIAALLLVLVVLPSWATVRFDGLC